MEDIDAKKGECQCCESASYDVDSDRNVHFDAFRIRNGIKLMLIHMRSILPQVLKLKMLENLIF
jgi:hypothetical protein